MIKQSETPLYICPTTEIFELYTEDILCTSGNPTEMTESLDEIMGQW